MPGFLKGSFFIGLLRAVFNALKRGYGTSRLKVFADACGRCFRGCIIYRLCSRYFNKPYYFEYSLTLRIIRGVVGILDIPVGYIGRFVRYLTGGSDVVAAANALADSDMGSKFKVTGVICLFVSLGFGAGVLLKGGGAEEFIAPGVLLIISLLLFALGKWPGCIKNSLIYRSIVWLVKA